MSLEGRKLQVTRFKKEDKNNKLFHQMARGGEENELY